MIVGAVPAAYFRKAFGRILFPPYLMSHAITLPEENIIANSEKAACDAGVNSAIALHRGHAWDLYKTSQMWDKIIKLNFIFQNN